MSENTVSAPNVNQGQCKKSVTEKSA